MGLRVPCVYYTRITDACVCIRDASARLSVINVLPRVIAYYRAYYYEPAELTSRAGNTMYYLVLPTYYQRPAPLTVIRVLPSITNVLQMYYSIEFFILFFELGQTGFSRAIRHMKNKKCISEVIHVLPCISNVLPDQ